jgi:hypothetical protein
MERNYNNEFERFLKQNADQYRLYPSSGVWKGIYAALHGRRRWVGLGVILLMLTGTLITLLITNSSKKNIVADNILPVSSAQPEPATTSREKEKDVFEIGKTIHTTKNKTGNSEENLVAIHNDTRSDEGTVLNTEPARMIAATQPVSNPISAPSITTATPEHRMAANNASLRQRLHNSDKSGIISPDLSSVVTEVTDQSTPPDESKNGSDKSNLKNTLQKETGRASAFDWTIESVLNSYKKQSRNKRFTLQLDLTPTISYRKLSENKWYMRRQLQNNSPVYTELYNVNSAVTHKPDMGLELGLSGKYAIASNFKVTAGLQFNINRYDIKAFYSPIETATIALNTGGSRVDSVRQYTNYRNFNGTKAHWLENFYFQVSVPVGVEVKLAGDDKVQFGLAGTIQPTYVLGDRAYLLTVDYKNYVEVPWLIRRWNANTAFETFVSYSTGKFKWQVGPQVRYQLLSSFVDKYPVKENLFDFGLKLGISLNNR